MTQFFEKYDSNDEKTFKMRMLDAYFISLKLDKMNEEFFGEKNDSAGELLKENPFLLNAPRIIEHLKSVKEGKPLKEKPKPVRKLGNIMKARSELEKVGETYKVETKMNVRDKLDDKVKRALIKSINDETKAKIKTIAKGSGIKPKAQVLTDESSSDDESAIKGDMIHIDIGSHNAKSKSKTGEGIVKKKLIKGSQEAKDYMASIRSKKGKIL
jgi:hypothetical protein